MRFPLFLFIVALIYPIQSQAQKFGKIIAVPENNVVRIEYDLLAAPYLGLTLQDLTEQEINSKQNIGDGRVKIIKLAPQSPAMKAGFEVGDIILNTGSVKISSASQLKEYLYTRLPGEKINFLISRGRKNLVLEPVPSPNRNPIRVEVYCSFDNYSQPLQLLEGDVGDNILAGMNKTVIWKGEEELGSYNGDLIFELHGYMQDPFESFFRSQTVPENSRKDIMVVSPASGSKLKNGKSYRINWTGGNPQDKLNIELYQEERVIATLAKEIPNTRSVNWKISKDLNPGKNYRIKIVDSQDNSVMGSSQAFRIKKSNTVQNILLLAATIATLIVVQTQL